jgi:hypothetical protein
VLTGEILLYLPLSLTLFNTNRSGWDFSNNHGVPCALVVFSIQELAHLRGGYTMQ